LTIAINNTARLRVWSESTFAADGTGTLGNFRDVPFIEGSCTAVLDETLLAPNVVQQHIDGLITDVLAFRRCKLSFQIHLTSTGTAAGSTVAAIGTDALAAILKAIFGGQNLGVGDTVASATNASTFVSTAAPAATLMTAGMAFGRTNTSTNRVEYREIESHGTGPNTIVTKVELGQTPVGTNVLFACATYSYTQNPTETLQFILEGEEQDDRWLLQGLQLESMSMDTPVNGLPLLTLNFHGVNWTHGATTAGVLTGSQLGYATYTGLSIDEALGECFITPLGTATAPTGVPISTLTFAPSLSYGMVTSPSGTQGVQRFRRRRTAPAVTVTARLPYEDNTWVAARTALTRQNIQWQFNTVAGRTVFVTVPTAQITNVQRVAEGEFAYQEITFKSQLDQDVGSTTTDSALSPIRIHRG
jgi:hypothetical protein